MKHGRRILPWAGCFLVLSILFLTPTVALADNCGSLQDCFQTQRAALAATVGLVVFGTLISLIPVIGTAKDLWEAGTGEDLLTKDKLSTQERLLGVLPFGIGKIAKVGKIAKAGDELGDASRVVRKDLPNHQKVVHNGSEGAGDGVPSYGKNSVPIAPYREVNGYPIKVKAGAQEKHIPNTPNYKQELANGKNKSIFYGDNKTAQELLDRYAGNGDMFKKGKERVDFGKPIGKYYDRNSGEYIETTKGIIHYGKDGAHIVPAAP